MALKSWYENGAALRKPLSYVGSGLDKKANSEFGLKRPIQIAPTFSGLLLLLLLIIIIMGKSC
jgi:hypothetical protein